MILKVAEEMEISEMPVSPTVPQWLLPRSTVDMSLLEKRDTDRGTDIMLKWRLCIFKAIILVMSGFIQMHVENRVGMAYTVIDFNVKVKRISDNISIH